MDIRSLVLVLAFSGCASAQPLPTTCSQLRTSGATDLFVIRTANLYRAKPRPFTYEPSGARVWVDAPAGMTEADLQRSLDQCSTPLLCVSNASTRVERAGAAYAVEVTSSSRRTAVAIQQRVAGLCKPKKLASEEPRGDQGTSGLAHIGQTGPLPTVYE